MRCLENFDSRKFVDKLNFLLPDEDEKIWVPKGWPRKFGESKKMYPLMQEVHGRGVLDELFGIIDLRRINLGHIIADSRFDFVNEDYFLQFKFSYPVEIKGCKLIPSCVIEYGNERRDYETYFFGRFRKKVDLSSVLPDDLFFGAIDY